MLRTISVLLLSIVLLCLTGFMESNLAKLGGVWKGSPIGLDIDAESKSLTISIGDLWGTHNFKVMSDSGNRIVLKFANKELEFEFEDDDTLQLKGFERDKTIVMKRVK